MSKKIKIAVLLVGLCLLSFYTSRPVTAEPSAPADVVNHTTQECAQIWPGDECRYCVPAEGWELLTGSCPAGYTILDHEAPTDCSLRASPYCCQTVNSDWEGCASYSAYTPPVSHCAILVCTMITGVGLFVWIKKKARRH